MTTEICNHSLIFIVFLGVFGSKELCQRKSWCSSTSVSVPEKIVPVEI